MAGVAEKLEGFKDDLRNDMKTVIETSERVSDEVRTIREDVRSMKKLCTQIQTDVRDLTREG